MQPGQIQIDQMQIDQMQIGDYVDVTYKKGKSRSYYIVDIQPKRIGIAAAAKPLVSHHLLTMNDRNIWQSAGLNLRKYTITFRKNPISIKYCERDFTQTPSCIQIIDGLEYKKRRIMRTFTELKNGIILHQLSDYTGKLVFTDPNSKSANFKIIYGTHCAEDYIIMNFGERNLQMNSDDKSFSNHEDSLRNPYDELFIYFGYAKKIAKLNLEDCSFTEYDSNPSYYCVYQLRYKKILCLLVSGDMYILDLINNTRIDVNSGTLELYLREYSLSDPLSIGVIHPMSTGDVIVKFLETNDKSDSDSDESDGPYGEICGPSENPFGKSNGKSNSKSNEYENPYGELYRINTSNGSLTKMVSLKQWIKIISILQDDKLLILNFDTKKFQIWKLNDNRIPEISTVHSSETIFESIQNSHKSVYSDHESHIKMGCSQLLQNGDVLFSIYKTFYLFDHVNGEIKETKLNILGISFIQQLQNGNLLVGNGTYLAIMEFPHSQHVIDRKSFDEIKPLILPSEMLALIRTYL